VAGAALDSIGQDARKDSPRSTAGPERPVEIPQREKQDLIGWARYKRSTLAAHDRAATGTTGIMLGRELEVPVTCLQSGPLGGDLQIGAMTADGHIDFLVFFWIYLNWQAKPEGCQATLFAHSLGFREATDVPRSP
jgi:hypothetical protein